MCGETIGTGKRLVATFSGRLVQSDLKSVVRNRHYIWQPTVSPQIYLSSSETIDLSDPSTSDTCEFM